MLPVTEEQITIQIITRMWANTELDSHLCGTVPTAAMSLSNMLTRKTHL